MLNPCIWIFYHLLYFYEFSLSFEWKELKLPERHIDIFFNNNPDIKQECIQNPLCPFKNHLYTDWCWGYEKNCSNKHKYSKFSCPGHHKGWVSTKEEQVQTFYDQADFGYVKEIRKQLKTYCQDHHEADSALYCSDHMQFCKGKNIMIDFRDLTKRKEPVRYHMDVLKKGQITGKCRLNSKLLKENADLISPLQSWGPELRHFTSTDTNISKTSPLCDVWIDKPAIITKIDASVSMYHHFCDFFNIYASLHVNNSDSHSFMTDTQILIWETYPYMSNFGVSWRAFTKNSIWNLDKVAGKRMCFSNVVFPLLPRMIFGLYYNTPIIWGCENSGLFHSFSHFMTTRLGIEEPKVEREKIQVSFLSRRTTHRRVLNEDELLKALVEDIDQEFIVRKVEFTHVDPFLDQLKQDQWTDILIGMHGSGLTHLLFLPDWAVVFELYSCGDPNCYNDLARLRGVKYMTWENESTMQAQDKGHHPQLGAHEKFTNYSFDKDEFVKLVKKAAKMIKQDPRWIKVKKKNVVKDEL